MTALADQLLESFLADQGSVAELLDRRSGELTEDLAEELRARYREALNARDGMTALGVTTIASLIYLRLGKRYEALKSHIDSYQLRFMAAETVSEYEAVRGTLLESSKMAKKINAPDLGFTAALTAADCAYFAYEASRQNGGENRWLLMSLGDLETAAQIAPEIAPDDVEEAWLQKFSSLLAAAATEAMSLIWTDKEEKLAKSRLRSLAGAAERLIPTNFDYTSEPARNSGIAKVLAKLSYEYGDAENADRRLDWAITQAENNGA